MIGRGVDQLFGQFHFVAAIVIKRAADQHVARQFHLTQHAQEVGADRSRVLIGGDSAGANLASVTANRQCAGPDSSRLCGVMLLYPATDHPDAGHDSYEQNASGYGLDARLMSWFWSLYAAGVSSDNPAISPLRLSKMPMLPRTLVATAEYDILRDEGQAYVQKLQDAGINVVHLHSPDMGHNFPVFPSLVA
ncbi:alpha/beta hydrolase fold domain-containing protein [Pseudomonas lini]